MADKPGCSTNLNKTQSTSTNASKVKRGGINCCVPHCTNNSLRNSGISFHKIPKDEALQKKWVKLLKTKGLQDIGPNYRVCSSHFPGGKKTYLNNIPTELTAPKHAKTRRQLFRQEIDTPKECEDELLNLNSNSELVERENLELSSVVCTPITNEMKLRKEIDSLKEKYNDLQKRFEQADKCTFRLERFIGSDHDFKSYTGFPDYATFSAFFDYLSPACDNLIYYGSNTSENPTNQTKHGKPRSLSPEQELFMVLSRLRCGLLLEDVAHRFGLSTSHVSRIWITWIAFLYQRLCALPIWPSRQFVDANMPACFKISYPQTRVIIDCTELFIERPSSCRSQSITYSSYKNHNTAKGLIGISPSGYPSFVSSLYAGRTSDRKITKDCGILDLLEPNDQIMADRGFDIQDDLPNNVTLNIPPFLDGKDQLSLDEELTTRKIASVRVHVERAIARIKSFRILHQDIPLTIAKDLDKIWSICTYLTLFLPPLIVEKEEITIQ